MPLDSVDELFLNELKDVYNAEKQLVSALPRMAKAGQSPQLQQPSRSICGRRKAR